MKKRQIKYFLLLLVLGVLLMFYLLNENIESNSSSISTLPHDAKKTIQTDVVDVSEQVDEDSMFLAKMKPRHNWEIEQDVDFTFYGRIVDQSGQSIQGVQITYVVTSYNDNFLNEVMAAGDLAKPLIKNEHQIFTDSNGEFIINAHGRRVLLKEFSKDGYVEKYEDRHFEFWSDTDGSQTSVGKNNPKVYVLWKLNDTGIAEQNLILSKSKMILKPNGKAESISFHPKNAGNNINSDVRILFRRDEDAKRHSPFNWSFEIQVLDGGIVETNDTFLYCAPEDGYQDTYKFSMNKNDPNWARNIAQKKFYIKSQKGSAFTALKVDVWSYYRDGALFDMEWVTNGEGSTNLEPKK